MATEKLKRHKSPGTDQAPAEMIKAGVGQFALRSINLLILFGIVPTNKKGDKTDCNNFRGISLLSTTYKILSNILLSRLMPYTEKIIADHQCGF